MRCSRSISTALFVYELYEPSEIVGVGIRQNAVTEVEDVAGSAPGHLQNVPGALPGDLERG